MNIKNITALAIAFAFITTSLLAHTVGALSVATISLAGMTSQNGSFSTTIYGNTNADTVAIASVSLDFSSAVSNVTYDYSVGPFKGTTPSGAHYSTGAVSGSQPIARVTFNATSPSVITATVSANSSLKHADGTTGATENFALSRGSATFTYSEPGRGNTSTPTTPTAPATPTNPTKPASTTPSTTTSSATATETSNQTAPEESKTDTSSPKTTDTTDKKHQEASTQTTTQSKPRSNGILWATASFVAVAAAIAGYFLWQRRSF